MLPAVLRLISLSSSDISYFKLPIFFLSSELTVDVGSVLGVGIVVGLTTSAELFLMEEELGGSIPDDTPLIGGLEPCRLLDGVDAAVFVDESFFNNSLAFLLIFCSFVRAFGLDLPPVTEVFPGGEGVLITDSTSKVTGGVPDDDTTLAGCSKFCRLFAVIGVEPAADRLGSFFNHSIDCLNLLGCLLSRGIAFSNFSTRCF